MRDPLFAPATIALVAACGAVGSVARLLLGALVQRASGGAFPWGTLAVNAVGSLGIGLAMELFAARGALSSSTRLAVTAGLLGGFTTYSAFAFETVALVESRAPLRAALYVGVTLLAGLAACWGGGAAARLLAR